MVSLRPVNFNDDWARLLAWRNDPVTRQNFLETEVVTVAAHREWLTRTMKDPTVQLYVASDSARSICVGQVRVDIGGQGKKAGRRFIISLTVDPRYRGQGYAEQVITALIAKWDLKTGDVMQALIKHTNYASIRAFTTAGFKFKSANADMVDLEYTGGH